MRKKHPEHVNLERWLVSYADFITLLFAFFVIMYAISQADIAKFKQVSASIAQAFNAPAPFGQLDLTGNTGGGSVNQFDSDQTQAGRIINMPAGKTHTASDPDPETQELRELMEETISLELGVSDLSEKLNMQYDSKGMLLRLAAKDFFDQGSVEVRLDMRPILDRIGKILSRTDRHVRIEGHTDPSEDSLAKKQGFSSDWELSAARAAWVVKYWMQRFEMDPKRLSASGMSHYRPLAKRKESDAGNKEENKEEAPTEDDNQWIRAKNRRVEIIILNSRYNN
ncbi:flagellar motor protein MotB [Bdellovibrionota bacterium FG-2]